MTTYKVYTDGKYLKLLSTNVAEGTLSIYGQLLHRIYDDFEGGNHVGYVFRNGLKRYYVFKEVA